MAALIQAQQPDLFDEHGVFVATKKVAKMARESRERKEPQAAGPEMLPIWPDGVRGVPNMALRSALFAAVKRGPRRYVKNEYIATVDGNEIKYTGIQLDQWDLDLWEALLHLVRRQELGKACRFTAYSILKMLGKTDTGKNRKILNRRLDGLKATSVQIKQGRYSYYGSLIHEFTQDEKTHEYVVALNPKIRDLYERDQFTLVDWAVRMELSGHPLAQWLHGFYASHAKPYPYSVAKIHALCGSENSDLRGFKRDMRMALAEVSQACEKQGHNFNTEIDGDLVFVDKQPISSQQNHLSRKDQVAHNNAMARASDLVKTTNSKKS